MKSTFLWHLNIDLVLSVYRTVSVLSRYLSSLMNHEAFYLVYFRSCNRIWCSRTGQLESDVVKTKTPNSKVMRTILIIPVLSTMMQYNPIMCHNYMYPPKLVTKNVLGTCDYLGEENNQLLQSRIICKFNDRPILHYNSATEMDNLFKKKKKNQILIGFLILKSIKRAMY